VSFLWLLWTDARWLNFIIFHCLIWYKYLTFCCLCSITKYWPYNCSGHWLMKHWKYYFTILLGQIWMYFSYSTCYCGWSCCCLNVTTLEDSSLLPIILVCLELLCGVNIRVCCWWWRTRICCSFQMIRVCQICWHFEIRFWRVSTCCFCVKEGL